MNNIALVISLISLFTLGISTQMYQHMHEHRAAQLLVHAVEQEYALIAARSYITAYVKTYPHVVTNIISQEFSAEHRFAGSTSWTVRFSLNVPQATKNTQSLVVKLEILHTGKLIAHDTYLLPL